jgi:hypothetical protein
MDYPDENDLPDSAIKAMWDEGEPVELATEPHRPVVNAAPSPWFHPAPTTTLVGRMKRMIVYFSSFGAATAPYTTDLPDASGNPTAAPSA